MMPLDLAWQEVAVRLALAVIAGALIGFNREARNQAAGLRTTALVCLAAALAMILANMLLHTIGKDESFFTQMDVLRLPLGVLSGIGFIGGGAIIRRGDAVTGVTTAATIWFMTVVGLCLGAGKLSLGMSATVLALVLLWGLRQVDIVMPRKFRAELTVQAQRAGLHETDLRRAIEQGGHRILTWGVIYEGAPQRYEVRAEVEWTGHEPDRGQEPAFVKALAANPSVLRAAWTPAPAGG